MFGNYLASVWQDTLLKRFFIFFTGCTNKSIILIKLKIKQIVMKKKKKVDEKLPWKL